MAGVVKSTAVPAYVTDLPTSDTSLNKHLLTPEKQLAMCRYWCLECCSHRKSRHVLEWPTKNADFIWNSLTIGVCELLELISKFVDVVLWCQSQLAVLSVSTYCDVSLNLLSLLYCSIAWQTRQLANLSATFIWICFHVKANMATLPALVSRYWSPFDSRTGAKICCCMPAFGANFENLYFTR